MTKLLNILMILFFATSTLSLAAKKDETMTERRARIMRKYLKRRVAVVKGSNLTPTDRSAENEDITNTEAYDNKSSSFKKQEGIMAMPNRGRRMLVRRKTGFSLEKPDDEKNPFGKKNKKKTSSYDFDQLKQNKTDLSTLTGYTPSTKSSSDLFSIFGTPKEKKATDYGTSKTRVRGYSLKTEKTTTSSIFGTPLKRTSIFNPKSTDKKTLGLKPLNTPQHTKNKPPPSLNGAVIEKRKKWNTNALIHTKNGKRKTHHPSPWVVIPFSNDAKPFKSLHTITRSNHTFDRTASYLLLKIWCQAQCKTKTLPKEKHLN